MIGFISKQVLISLIFACIGLTTFSPVTAQEEGPIGPKGLLSEIEEFAELKTDAYIMWQYSGDRNSSFSLSDKWSIYRSDSNWSEYCEAFKAGSALLKVGVNIRPAGELDPATLDSHFTTLQSCNITLVRMWAPLGDIPGLNNVLAAAANHGIQLVIAISDPVIGLKIPNFPIPNSWLSSDHLGEYKQFATQVAQAAAANASAVYAVELSNEPHCSGDASKYIPFKIWVSNMSALVSNIVPDSVKVGIGQMGNVDKDVEPCDNTKYGELNSLPTISAASGHYYTTPEKKQVILSKSKVSVTFYIGEAGFAGEVDEEYDPTGSHTCRNFCTGIPYDPCSQTPELDCSIPFDYKELFAPVDQLETGNQRLQEIIGYLTEYLPQTTINYGVQYEYRAEIKDEEYCKDQYRKPNSYLDIACTKVPGDGTSTVEIEGRTINFIGTPTQQIKQLFTEVAPDRLNHIRQVFNAPTGATKEELGMTQKLQAYKAKIRRLAILADHKEACYQEGRVVKSKTVPVFGKIRCMNYSDWTDVCRSLGGCSFPQTEGKYTEKGLWESKLQSCIYYGRNPNEQIWQACNQNLKALTDTERNLIEKSTDVPVARRLIIGGIEQLPAYREDTELISYTEEPTLLNITQTIDSDELDPGQQRTLYYVYDIVAGDDAQHASQQMLQFTTPFLANQNTIAAAANKPRGGLFNFIQHFLDILRGAFEFIYKPAPFWYQHIPEQFFDPIDFRYFLIQLAFNRSYEKCLELSQDADKSLNDALVPAAGSLSSPGNQSVATPLANVWETIQRLLEGRDSTQDFRLQRYLNCELYPAHLSKADKYAEQIIHNFYPYKWNQSRVPQVLDRPLESETAVTTTFSTNPQVPSNCACHDKGGADNPPVYSATSPGDGFFQDAPGVWYLQSCTPPGYLNINCPLPQVIAKRDVNTFSNRPESAGFADGNLGIHKYQAQSDGQEYNTFVRYEGGITAQLMNLFQDNLMWSIKDIKDPCWREDYYIENLKACQEDSGPSDPNNPPSPYGTCNIEGGFPIASQALKDLIGAVSKKYNVPVEVVMSALWIENCRTGSSICTMDDSQIRAILAPGIEYRSASGCSQGGKPDVPFTGVSKGVFQFFHNICQDKNGNGVCDSGEPTNDWGYWRENPSSNICSIYDSAMAAGKHLSHSNNGQGWSIDQIYRTLSSYSSATGFCNQHPFADAYCDVVSKLMGVPTPDNDYQASSQSLTKVTHDCN